MGSKQPTQTTQTVQNAPPAYLEPYYRQSAQAASDLYNQGGGFYTGSLVAPFSSQTNQALQLAEQRAVNGSPLEQSAQNAATATARGDFLGTNPYLSSALDAANRSTVRQFRDATQPGIQGNFARAGRYGSNAQTNAVQGAQEALATGLADTNSRVMAQQYDAERGRQLQAAGLASQLSQLDFRNLQVLEGVGGTYDEQAQAQLGDQARLAELNRARLDDYVARLNGVSGNYQNSTTAGSLPRQSRAAGALGGAASGAGVGFMVGGPVGAGIGAGIGGLGGLLF